MTLEDFGLSVYASWLANNIDELLGVRKVDVRPEPIKKDVVDKEPPVRLFETFDVFLDLEKILPNVLNPVAHILVETTPSNFYNLACMIVESRTTGEWYVFRRGRMAFQGSGGGTSQSKRALSMLRDVGGATVAWAADQKTIENLEKGLILW